MTPTDPPPRKDFEAPRPLGVPGSPARSDQLLEFETEVILGDSDPKVAATKSAEDPGEVEITTSESDIALEDLDFEEGDDPCPSPFERITLAPKVPEREYVASMMRQAPKSTPAPSSNPPPASNRVPTVSRPVTQPPETVARPALTEELALESLEDDDPSQGRISGTISTNPSSQVTPLTELTADSLSSWPAPPDSEPLTLDLGDSAIPPPIAQSSAPPLAIPGPPSLPDEVPTGVRDLAPIAPSSEPPPLIETRANAKVEPPRTAPLSFGPTSGDALELVGVRAQSVKPPQASPSITMRAVRDRFDVGDFSGALILAEGMLENDPESVDALLYAEHCRDVLKQMYISRLGGVGRVPKVAVSDEQLRWLSLDHRAGFLLSLVDGRSSFEEVLDMSGMPPIDALRLLLELLQQNVIKV